MISRRVQVLLLIALAIVALAFLFDSGMRAGGAPPYSLDFLSFDDVNGSQTTPFVPGVVVTLAGDASPSLIRLTFEPPQFVGQVLLEMIVKGNVNILQGNAEVPATDSSRFCRTLASGLTCRIPLQVGASPDAAFVEAESGEAKVQVVRVINVNQHQLTWATSLPALLLLLSFTPLAASIGFIRGPSMRRALIIALSATFIILLSPAMAAMLACFVALAYVGLLGLSRKALRLASVVLALLGVIVMVKVIWPLIGVYVPFGAAWIVLPIGLSYMIARCIDLGVRLSSGQAILPSPMAFVSYVIFWPSFLAGPIAEVNGIHDGKCDYPVWAERSDGAVRIARGFAKKMLADLTWTYLVAERSASVIAWPDGSPFAILLVSFGNLAFVYLDFSGYSDIAVGTARLMGVRLPENFDSPLTKSNLRSFWQAWHMSLTRWVNRNVFMPISMAVRREPKLIAYVLPVLATTTVIGLWHGLQIVWLLWALHHAVGIFATDWVVKRFVRLRGTQPWIASIAVQRAAYIFGVCFVWFWIILSYSFTLTSNTDIAIQNYINLWRAPFELVMRVL
jgi:D-alanyl-lipoteichoic acid acyltransferase DltB (MBOAT superfamily)